MVDPSSVVPGVLGLHHVALAVSDIDSALALWTGSLGGHLELRAAVPEFGVEAASIEWSHGTLLELIAPLDETSGVAKFIASRGEGFHHVAYAVEDVSAALAALQHDGRRVLDAEPRIGLHGTPVAFLHPSAMGGTLVELVEVPAAP